MNIKTLISKIRHIKKAKVIYPFFTLMTIIFFAGVMYHTLGFLTKNIAKALDPVNADESALHLGDAKLVIVLKRLNVAGNDIQLPVQNVRPTATTTSTEIPSISSSTPQQTQATSTESIPEDENGDPIISI